MPRIVAIAGFDVTGVEEVDDPAEPPLVEAAESVEGLSLTDRESFPTPVVELLALVVLALVLGTPLAPRKGVAKEERPEPEPEELDATTALTVFIEAPLGRRDAV